MHWCRERGPRWRIKAAINGLGALASAIVALVAGGTKFISGEPLFQLLGVDVRAGSWIVIALIPFLMLNFLGIHRHYRRAAEELAVETPLSPEAIQHVVVVPDQQQRGATITVVLPELVPAHWWEQPLHTQTALRLKAALLCRPGTVVSSVPYHLEREAGTGFGR